VFESEVHFGAQVPVPDLAAWRRSRTPRFDTSVAYHRDRPSWVAEVITPSTARIDRIRKMEIYRESRVEHAWLVEPRSRLIEVFENGPSGWIRTHAVGEEAEIGLPPFDAVPLAVGCLWLDAADDDAET
jgi:Uma2 family endonuclease